MSHRGLVCIVAMILAVGGLMPAALAHDESDVILYQGGPVRKLGRGLGNLATSWAELPLNMERTAKEEGEVAGVTLGALRGVCMTAARTLAGGFETLTFLLPNPEVGYAPLMDPEYLPIQDLL